MPGPEESNRLQTPGEKSPPISLTGASATVVASMIGVGIFASPGYTLEALGTGGLSFLAWFVGALIALCGALSYGALARQMAESGGEYLYLSRTVHPWAGFVAGWTSLFAGFAGPTAAAALALEQFLPMQIEGQVPWIAIVAILACSFAQAFSTRAASWTQAILVFAKVTFLATISIAMTVYALGSFESPQVPTTTTAPTDPATIGVFATSLMWISFAYTGFNAAIYFASEVDNAKVNVPRAMLLGTAVTVMLYLGLVGSLYGCAAYWYDGSANPNPFQELASATLGSQGAMGLNLVVSLCLLTSVSSLLLTGPHVTARMAGDGLFPGWLQGALGRPPRAALVLQTVIAATIVSSTRLQDLITHLGMTLSLCSAASVSTLFFSKSGRVSWVTRASAFIYIAATLSFAALAIRHNHWNAAGTAGILMTATVAYAVMRSSRHSRIWGNPDGESAS